MHILSLQRGAITLLKDYWYHCFQE